MTKQCFTIGVYENLWVYVRLLALEAQKLIANDIVEKVEILWYKLNDEPLLDWIAAVENNRGHMHAYPFGESPYLLNLTGDEGKIPGLTFTGQADMPAGCLPQERHVYRRPLPNLFVVDHHLFDLDTAGLVLRGSGHAHIILKGLREYSQDKIPPIFLSSQKSLAGEIGLDTLRLGRGLGSRVSWFPRPEGDQPKNLPDGFAHALREEVGLWLRCHDLLGTIHEEAGWRRYDPPFEHTLIHYDRRIQLDETLIENAAKADDFGNLMFLNEPLSTSTAHEVLARHCKAYLEIRKDVNQNDLSRLRDLTEQYPLPIVLLYWNTAQNVPNLADSGVLAQLMKSADVEHVQTAAIEWTQRMAVLDTVVGGEHLREIRNDLLRWRLAAESTRRQDQIQKPLGKALLIVGPTGAGKMAISKWCHLYSTHFADDDELLYELLSDIPAPDPENRGQALSFSDLWGVSERRQGPEFLRQWARKIIDHAGADGSRQELSDSNLLGLLLEAFRTTHRRPWQVNLVGVTQHDDFLIQMAGIYPIWTDAQWPENWQSGKILQATNNTLILNEIGELDSDAQGLLLELIERGGPLLPKFALTGVEVQAKNILFILATDRIDRLREQLVRRCRVFRVPSLLECQADIPKLAVHRLLPRWCCLSERAEQILKKWPYWPGNHRSLHAVLDFAAERLPSSRRVIRVQHLIKALLREDLILIPSRLERLVNWILNRPELDTERPGNILSNVIAGLVARSETDWSKVVQELNDIADATFENSSAHFSAILGTKKSRRSVLALNPADTIKKAVGLFMHEIFLTFHRRAERLQKTINSAIKLRNQIPLEIAGGNLEERIITELKHDAITTLTLATVLWMVLETSSATITEANDLLCSRAKKRSGRKKERKPAENNEQQNAERTEVLQGQKENGDDEETNDMTNQKNKDAFPTFGGTQVSDIRMEGSHFAFAVIKSMDSAFRGSLFEYAEDRNARDLF